MTTTNRSTERSWLSALLFRSSIASRLAAAFAVMSAVTLGLLWVLVSYNLKDLLVKQTDAFGSTIAKQVADAATEMVLADDHLSLNVIVTKVAQSPSVESAVIFDRQNKVLAKAGTSDDPAKFASNPEVPDFGTYRAPIVFQDVTAGYIDITINKNVIAGTIKQTLFIMTAATSGLLIVSLLVALRLSKQLTAPVKKLTEAADAIREGNFSFRIEEEERRNDELGVLIDSFNHMAEGLQEKEKIRDTFSRFISPVVADNILSDLGSPDIPMGYVSGSVMFVDIVGFTSLCESNPPSKIAALLNRYYDLVVQAAKPFDGVVDKFIGDGAMVIFGAPNADAEHAFHAICCALMFQCLAGSFNEERAQKGEPHLSFRIGVHSGEMIAGTLGCIERIEYTVVGDTVNTAARLCSMAPVDKILISQITFDLADGFQRLVTHTEKTVDIRGKTEPVPTLVVEDLESEYRVELETPLKEMEASAEEAKEAKAAELETA